MTKWHSIRLPSDMFELMKQYADEQHRSVSAEVLVRLEQSLHGDRYHHVIPPVTGDKEKKA